MDDVYAETEKKMGSSIDTFQKEIGSLRTGRASVSLLDSIKAEYFGAPTPLNQLATLAAPESRLLTIQPWDPGALPSIEKALQSSDLGLTPNNDGKLIRINIPMMTEERRKELVKLLKKMAEECKVAIRNVRRDGNEKLKGRQKSKEITEDDLHKAQDKVQKITDSFVGRVDTIADAKEKEILEIS